MKNKYFPLLIDMPPDNFEELIKVHKEVYVEV
jgi:hypothetical protein